MCEWERLRMKPWESHQKAVSGWSGCLASTPAGRALLPPDPPGQAENSLHACLFFPRAPGRYPRGVCPSRRPGGTLRFIQGRRLRSEEWDPESGRSQGSPPAVGKGQHGLAEWPRGWGGPCQRLWLDGACWARAWMLLRSAERPSVMGTQPSLPSNSPSQPRTQQWFLLNCLLVSFFFPVVIFFNWSIVDLKCCLWFWCIAQWFSYTHICIFFHYRLLQGIVSCITSCTFYS